MSMFEKVSHLMVSKSFNQQGKDSNIMHDVIPFRVDNEAVEDIIELCSGVNTEELLRTIKLPYPKCFFELGKGDEKVGVVLFESVDAKIFMFVFIERPGKPELDMLTCHIVIHPHGNTDFDSFETVYAVGIDDADKPDDNTLNIMKRITVMVLYSINCEGLVSFIKEDFSKLNKKRTKRGKYPKVEYTTIKLNVPSRRYHNPGSVIGGATKRPHLRRGHFRRYPNKTVWVRNCTVGTKDEVKQSYRIK